MNYFDLVILAGFATAYYRLGEIEYGRGLLLGAVSAALWIATRVWLGWGWGGSIGVQLGIFVVLTAVNLRRV